MEQNQHNHRVWQQLRDLEATFFSPSPPPDPIQKFADGWRRAESVALEDVTAKYMNRNQSNNNNMPLPPPPPPPMRPPPRQQDRVDRHRQPRPRANVQPYLPQNHQIDQIDQIPEPHQPRRRRRALSPSQLPGVRAIPKDFSRALHAILAPGEFFVKSRTRYLGPYDELPTAEVVPANDEYIVLQRMGRLPESGKSIFRQVGTLST